jgi:hypothetical protein
MDILEYIVQELYKLPQEELTNENLHKIKKNASKLFSVRKLPTNIQLQKKYTQLLSQ